MANVQTRLNSAATSALIVELENAESSRLILAVTARITSIVGWFVCVFLTPAQPYLLLAIPLLTTIIWYLALVRRRASFRHIEAIRSLLFERSPDLEISYIEANRPQGDFSSMIDFLRFNNEVSFPYYTEATLLTMGNWAIAMLVVLHQAPFFR